MTSDRTAKVNWIGLSVLLLASAASILCVQQMDSRDLKRAQAADNLLIPSPKVLKRMSLGYEGLLADIYWTRIVQYFGALHATHANRFPLLSPLLDIATELDPKLDVAYEFGATFLAQKPPQGAGDPQAAIELVRRGIRANPDKWRLYYNLGFIYAMELKDYAAAAQAFQQGSEVKGAHPWMKVMAAAMAQHGGDAATARYLWSNIYESSEDRSIRQNAMQHLQSMKADEDMTQLERLAAAFHERSGHYPAGINELVAAGWLGGVPIDPAGHPFRLLPNGKVLLQSVDDLPFTTKGRPADAVNLDVLAAKN